MLFYPVLSTDAFNEAHAELNGTVTNLKTKDNTKKVIIRFNAYGTVFGRGYQTESESWYLNEMVTQNMYRTHEGNISIFE